MSITEDINGSRQKGLTSGELCYFVFLSFVFGIQSTERDIFLEIVY